MCVHKISNFPRDFWEFEACIFYFKLIILRSLTWIFVMWNNESEYILVICLNWEMQNIIVNETRCQKKKLIEVLDWFVALSTNLRNILLSFDVRNGVYFFKNPEVWSHLRGIESGWHVDLLQKCSQCTGTANVFQSKRSILICRSSSWMVENKGNLSTR